MDQVNRMKTQMSLEQPEIFCNQSKETVIASDRLSCSRSEYAKESHDFQYEINNDSFVAESEEELHQWSSSDNNTTDSENEQSESSSDNNTIDSENEESEPISDNEDGVFQFPNNEAREMYVTETIREWASEGGVLSMTKLNDLLLRLNVVRPNLPKNYKSLLKTPSHLNIVEMEQAQI